MEQLLTDPKEASEFVSETGVDALAIAVGTSHGAYKFSRPPTGDILAIDRIKEIHEKWIRKYFKIRFFCKVLIAKKIPVAMNEKRLRAT